MSRWMTHLLLTPPPLPHKYVHTFSDAVMSFSERVGLPGLARTHLYIQLGSVFPDHKLSSHFKSTNGIAAKIVA